jgi:type II secretory pathway component PulM
MLGLTGFFVRERIRARRQRLGVDAPLFAKLEADLAELRRQRHLLLNIGKWYLAPCMAAAAIFAATTMAHAPIPWPAKLLAGVVMLLLLALTYWGVWALNRRAVRVQLDPRLEELEQLHRNLLGG